MNKHELAKIAKRLLYPYGESYEFAGKKLNFEVGSRPIRRKYIDSDNYIVRNDVLQIEYFEKNFGSGDVLWDIGSHHGHYSIFAASVAAGSSQVYSFEPDRDAARVQMSNIKTNKLERKISLRNLAVSNVAGTVQFSSQGGNSNSHLVKENDNGSDSTSIISVPSNTLNGLYRELPTPTFVKIDTEGAEIDIISEASALLSESKIRFICELHPFAWEGMNVSYKDLLQKIEGYNRTITPLDPNFTSADLPYYGTVLF